MADAQYTLCLFGCLYNDPTFRFTITHRLFQQHMIPLLQRGHRWFHMHVIQRTYQCSICQLRVGQQLFPAAERHVIWDTVSAAYQSTPILFWFRYGYDSKLFRMFLRIMGVNLSPRTCTDENRRYLFHCSTSFFARMRNNSS